MAHDLTRSSEIDPALKTLDRLNPNHLSSSPSPALGRIGHPGNGAFLEELHESLKTDPTSVDPTWRAFFEGFELGDDAREADFGAIGGLLWVAEGEIEPAIFRVIGMGNDVEKSGLPAGVDGGHATQGTICEFAVLDEVEVAAFLSDDGLGGREKGERPRFFESSHPGVELIGVKLTLRRHGFGGLDELGFFAASLGADLANVDNHRTDFLVRKRVAPGGHALVGKPVAYAFSEALVVAAVGPDVVEHRWGHGAFEVFTVTVSAKELKALGHGAGADGLGGEAWGRQREGAGGEGEERAKEERAGKKHAPFMKASAGQGARLRIPSP